MRDAAQGQAAGKDYNAWFRGEIERALEESEDGKVELISDDDVKAAWDGKRAGLTGKPAS